MVTVTLNELIAQTNALPEDATLLQLYADAAEEQIEVDINRPLSDLLIEPEPSDENEGAASEATEEAAEGANENAAESTSESVGSYPTKIKLAVLLLVGHWYRNREAFSTVELKEVPKTYNTLIASFRDYAKPYRS